MQRLLEIRLYALSAGSGPRFHQLVSQQSLPLLREWGMDVVAFGLSVSDPDSYFLMRAFDNLEHLTSSQDAFYASEAWRKGPREAIIGLIKSDLSSVLQLNVETIDAMRRR
ncbi:NIPSNAP family protein [Solimicrobium silvestre]|uniref:NIPSNAP protein n=1 Tax=Solimicrobium silvestre TaxID=2099400 RepID=A0A2S9H3S6_9BURK|nr:NIPSNAP family protein [Solimicrobium silvestre]PRC94629.1 NIPSNAP protein [Solimicrobium silvestre]